MKLKFNKGLKADLPSTGYDEGAYYQCTDTGELFFALSSTVLKQVSDVELQDAINYITIVKNTKVDKVDGKGLSTNDYTTTEKTKLAGLENYDDTAVYAAIADEEDRAEQAEQTLQSGINTLNALIPSQASSTNQLADKAFVNSTVQTATANFRGNWSTKAAIPTVASLYPVDYAGSHTPTVNDYLVVQADETHSGQTWRYKYSGIWATDGVNGWHAEYMVNETPLTAAQLAALNSNITSEKVSAYDSHLSSTSNPHAVTKSQVGLGNVGNYKAVSTVANQGLTDVEQTAARENIGAIGGTTVKTIVVCTQAEYDAISTKDVNTEYNIKI
ncbi:MAG: hypothetical protein MJY71_02390 [Bacteroidaceae bacterium]|nr:hypothetical protein [Bacteroidaceae bacterium]